MIHKPRRLNIRNKQSLKYFDSDTFEEFPYFDLNKHPNYHTETYNADGKIIYRDFSDGYWVKWEYNEKGEHTYWETASGILIDRRWVE